MSVSGLDQIQDVLSSLTSTEPRPGLHPIPGTRPLTLGAALCPPLLYYLALLLLPPPPPPAIGNPVVKAVRNLVALLAGILFFRLPLAYHVPQSIGLTYQLGLVGLYGGCRVLDAFFVSPYLFNHIPRRVTYYHKSRVGTPDHIESDRPKAWSDGGLKDPFSSNQLHSGAPLISKRQPKQSANTDEPGAPQAKIDSINDRSGSLTEDSSYFLQKVISGPDPIPVYETAQTDKDYPHTLLDRASWALELELSMRGMGFTWTTADVRHTRKTWLPTPTNRIHSILVHVLPTLIGAWVIINFIYTNHLASTLEDPNYDPFVAPIRRNQELFDRELAIPQQLILTLALGAFLMAAFSFGHSLFAIMLHPLSPHALAFFPPLYTTQVWQITSVRHFWSFGWHRLFARLFLVWGVWPGEWIERKLTGKNADQPADIGKVLGAFASSGFVHSFSARGVLAGSWSDCLGEARFFGLNGVAVVLEGLVVLVVRKMRKRNGWAENMWYDGWVGRVWWISVLLWTGRNFARGWVKSSLVREMAFK